MLVRYCNAACQLKHWATHKKECKLQAAELHDVALFKDPPPKEDCPICFLPMPINLLCCASLPLATTLSVPIYDFAHAHEELAGKNTEEYYACCGKYICQGCLYSLHCSGDNTKCPFCNSDRASKTDEENVEEGMKRVAANDAGAMYILAGFYYQGVQSFQQDYVKAIELFTKSADLGFSKAHNKLGDIYQNGGDLKKAEFHLEAAAMAGNEVARNNLGVMQYNLGNRERAMKHWMIAASAGCFNAMYHLITFFKKGYVSRESINSTLASYNSSCAEIRSDTRDACICAIIKNM